MFLGKNRKAPVACDFNVLWKLKDFSRSQTFTYTGNGARYRRCYYRLQCIYTTRYNVLSNRAISDDLE